MFKKILLYALVFICLGLAQAEAVPFITRWNIATAGEQIHIPIVGTSNFSINWGDGQTDNGQTTSVSHTYAAPGIYTVSISGSFGGVSFVSNNAIDSRTKLLSIEQWGDNVWQNMGGAFYGCSNMVSNAVDFPNVSQVQNMSVVFYNASSFNADLSQWDVSSATNMSYMFYGASAFNGNISTWNVSNVTQMTYMFAGATSFNQNINNWNTASLQNTSYMFYRASAFNQPLNNWNVSGVTSMTAMFREATSFNRYLNDWDVSQVGNVSFMFYGASAFNGSLAGWYLASATNTASMFQNAYTFQGIGLETWDMSLIQSTNNMFTNAYVFNADISGWDMGSVVTMATMFGGAQAFNQPIGSWNVSNVQNMSQMFSGAYAFNQDISGWDVSSLTSMSYMFTNASSFNQDLSSWDVSNVITMFFAFTGTPWSAYHYDRALEAWAQLPLQPNVTMHSSSRYCNGASARSAIIANFGWAINDAGQDCTATLPLGYCASSGTLTGDDWIKRVQISRNGNISLDHFSGRDNGYADNTQSVPATTLGRSLTYTFAVSPGRRESGTGRLVGYKIWVDWNRDGDFRDAGELAFSRNLTDKGNVQGPVVIPATASLGLTRMRVQAKYGQVPFGSCEAFSRGEVEDYAVNISNSALQREAGEARLAAGAEEMAEALSAYPNPAFGQATVWLPEGAERLLLYSLQGQQLGEWAVAGQRTQVLSLQTLPSGLYVLVAAGASGSSSLKLQVE
jgi:surface protein